MTILSIVSLHRTLRLATFLPLTFALAACSDGVLTSGTTGSGATTGSDTTTGSGGGTGTGGSAGTAGSTGSGGDGGSSDTTAPFVVSTSPLAAATGEAINLSIRATFSEAMKPLTVSAESFILKQGDLPVAGVVSYAGDTALFVPSSKLALDTTYIATITTSVTDLAGNALAEDYTWKFRTDAKEAIGPAPVLLGAAGQYVILAKSTITNVPTSKITGDIALSPAAASYITGFSLTKAGTHWTAPQVVGRVFAADNDPPTPINLTTAVGDMQTAYTDAAGRPTPAFLELGAGSIGGLTLTPGLYKWTTTVTIPADVTLSGAANDVWIFQITGDLQLASAKAMKLIGGARPRNIFWQVAGDVVLGTTSHAEGIMLSKSAIKLGTGASINGRLYAQTAVNLAGVTVTAPAP